MKIMAYRNVKVISIRNNDGNEEMVAIATGASVKDQRYVYQARKNATICSLRCSARHAH